MAHSLVFFFFFFNKKKTDQPINKFREKDLEPNPNKYAHTTGTKKCSKEKNLRSSTHISPWGYVKQPLG